MSEAEQRIGAMLETYAAAARAKDVERFVELYDEDVRVFDMWGAWSYRGLAAWRETVEGWFGSLGDEQVGVEFRDVEVVDGRELASAHTTVTYRGLSAAGDELRHLDNRMTWVVARRGDGWKVVHEHSSAPASFETMQVILEQPEEQG